MPCSPLQDRPNPGIKPRSPTLQMDSLPSEPQGKLNNTGVGSYPFYRGTSWLRNQTGVSYIAGIFFTSWANWEAHITYFVYHMWNKSPVQVWCMIQDARDWYTGMTQRDGMGRELGGGLRMGNMCTPVVDSCWCMAKPIQYCKVISLQLK